jgi:uncharacterized membrane protein
MHSARPPYTDLARNASARSEQIENMSATLRARKLLLAAHILVTVSVLGADLALLTLGIRAVAGMDASTVYPAAHLIASRLIAPLALASLATGLALVFTSPDRLLSQGWVVAKLAITVVLAAVLILVLVPGLERLAEQAITRAPDPVTTAQRLRVAIGPAIASVLLAVNVALAVYKPRRRRRA